MAAEDGVVSGHAAPGGGLLAGGGSAAHGGEKEKGGREGGWRGDVSGGVTCEYDPELDGPFG